MYINTRDTKTNNSWQLHAPVLPGAFMNSVNCVYTHSTLLSYQCLLWLCLEEITFERAPANQYLRRYAAGVIQCVVSGQPLPTVSWRFRGSRIVTGCIMILVVSVGKYIALHSMRFK